MVVNLMKIVFNTLQQLSEILANDELEVGSFELDIFEIKINKIKTYEEELIKCLNFYK